MKNLLKLCINVFCMSLLIFGGSVASAATCPCGEVVIPDGTTSISCASLINPSGNPDTIRFNPIG